MQVHTRAHTHAHTLNIDMFRVNSFDDLGIAFASHRRLKNTDSWLYRIRICTHTHAHRQTGRQTDRHPHTHSLTTHTDDIHRGSSIEWESEREWERDLQCVSHRKADG